MWETVQLGLRRYDYNKIKPFLILFQHMLEARDSPAQPQLLDTWMEELFTNVIRNFLNIYQWMETMIDFVIKIGVRIPECRQWMLQNVQTWSYLLEWLKANQEPPQAQNYYGQNYQNSIKLNKLKYTKMRDYRYNKAINQALLFVRRNYLI